MTIANNNIPIREILNIHLYNIIEPIADMDEFHAMTEDELMNQVRPRTAEHPLSADVQLRARIMANLMTDEDLTSSFRCALFALDKDATALDFETTTKKQVEAYITGKAFSILIDMQQGDLLSQAETFH